MTSTTPSADIDDAIRRAVAAKDQGQPLSIGLLGNAADEFPSLLKMNAPIDIVTDQTSAHDPSPTCRRASSSRTWPRCGPKTPRGSPEEPASRWPPRWPSWSGSSTAVPRCSTTATPSVARPNSPGTSGPSPSRASSPPTSGRCSARARARSAGRRCPATRRTSPRPARPSSTCSRRTRRLAGGCGWPGRRCTSRGFRPGSAGSATASGTWPGCASTRWSPAALSAPIVLGRDHLDCGSVASPYRETEAMADGSDIAGRKLERVLTNDPATGVIRHTDAGYDQAAEVARERGVRVPMADQ